MAISRRPDDALAEFQLQGRSAHTFRVARWHGTEAISQPYRFEIDVVCDDARLDVATLVGQRATLTVRDATGEYPWHGVVTSLMDQGDAGGSAFDEVRYTVVLEPRLALLRAFRRSEVFLDKDIADLIRHLLAQCGLRREGRQDEYALLLSASTPALTRKSFVCQFEESSLDFLSRRLERDGIYYWFEQQRDGETVVFADRRDDQPRVAEPVVWRPDEQRDSERTVHPVMRMTRHVQARVTRVRVGNFAASRADLDLSQAVPVPDDTASRAGMNEPAVYAHVGEQAVYGDHYDGHAAGQRLARIRAEALACEADTYAGISRALPLRAGYRATLQGHARPAFDRRYCVTAITHEGSQPLPGEDASASAIPGNYRNEFRAIDDEVQFRTPHQTRWPRVIGLVSAIVEAEGTGQYAELNENGCYKVRFPFATTQHAASHNSAWVRMATPYAGSGHGMHLPLLKGTEVLVSFIGGDPDRPIITAAVPNSENPNMLNGGSASQPGLRTAGGNALAFEDREGQQRALLGSPVGQSHIAFGAGDGQNGIQLQSQDHVGMASSSYDHQVPGIYRMRVVPIGSDLLDGADAAASTGQDGTGDTSTPPATPATPTPAAAATDDAATRTNKSLSTTWWGGFGAIKSNVGLIVTDYLGSASSVYLGNQNSVCVGVKTDVTIAASFGLAIKGGKVLTLFDHLTFDATKYSKKIKEDITVGKSDVVVGDQTIKAVTKTENLGTYACTALGTHEVQALSLRLKTTSQSSQLHLDPASATLGTMDLTLEGALTTTLGGAGGSLTNVKGARITVGQNGRTASVALAATNIQMNFQASAAVNGTGQLSLAGGLVRVG